MSKIEVNEIDKQNGSTLTLGGSGTAVTLASGATQSGFGRTGTVDWQTTKKTTSFTAVNGEGYFVDTAASGAVTMTLPSSPSAGNIVAVKDYNGNFNSANLTIGRGGSPINGASGADVAINTAGASIVLVYVDATQGWVATQDDSSTFTGDSFITASGGTETECGNCKIHTFTGPGTFTVSGVAGCAANNVVSYIVVAGGGSGGSGGGPGSATSGAGSGGGGAGGFRETKSPITPYTASPLCGYSTPGNRITVTAQAYGIVVGGGGTAASPGSQGTDGGVSTFSTITSAGGGAGGSRSAPSNGEEGHDGGSGGGSVTSCTVGQGNTPPVTPPQGNNGGAGPPSVSNTSGGGGGGATAVGANNAPGSGGGIGGNGGAGATSSINGTPTARAGGGGGGAGGDVPSGHDNAGGSGGSGGGGAGGRTGGAGTNGTDNTGGGGGGGGSHPGKAGGNGGGGIVIIRYKYQN